MSQNTMLILAALVGFGIAIASALRGALTAQVPPAWIKLPAKYRPIAASAVSAVLVFLVAVQAGQSMAAAGAAAITTLGASLAKLIATEGDAAGAGVSAPAAAPAPAPAVAPAPAAASPPAPPAA